MTSGPVDAATTPVETTTSRLHLPAVFRAVAGRPWWLAWLIVAGVFTLLGAGNLDLGRAEARLGMAVGEPLGPLGQVYGQWEPGLWPGRVAIAQAWGKAHGGRPTAASVRWPEAIAAVLAGLIVAVGLARVAGDRAGAIAGLAFLGSIGLMHRGWDAGIDPVAGLLALSALYRIMRKGPDWAAGLWTAAAFLVGGWPAVLLVLLPTVVLGTRDRWLSPRLVLPVVAVAAAWTAWSWRVAGPQATAAALTLPFTQGLNLALSLKVLALSLPFGPLAVLVFRPGVRASMSETACDWARDWARIGIVAVLAGSLVPGLAPTAGFLALAALGTLAASVLEAGLSPSIDPSSRRAIVGLSVAVVLLGCAILTPSGAYLSAAVSYYRGVAVVLMIGSIILAAMTVIGARLGRARIAVISLGCLALAIKVAYAGVYVPEWNYQRSQGPWGRAVGQWVPPSWPIYIVHGWPDDLMFHTERTVRRLPAPEVLAMHTWDRPPHVLLLEAEFKRWPKSAPRLIEVRRFQDQRGDVRVLARTDGPMMLGQTTADPEG
jgi:hypothetical protein